MASLARAHVCAIALSALSATGCAPVDGSIDDGPLGASDQPIVNGQFDTGDPAVVALAANGYVVCTGTLITPTVVLTAAHCLPPHISAYTNDVRDMAVFIGSDVNQPGTLIDVQEGWVHPAWHDEAVQDDIGLLRLTNPAAVAPLTVNTVPLTNNDVGDTVRMIGFGMTSENNHSSVGRKRQGSSVVGEVFPPVFTMPTQPSGTCSGDSGGTALMNRGAGEVLVGIHSRSDCVSTAIDTRADAYLPQINAFIGVIEPGCGIDGQCASGCSEPDPDCPCAGDGYCTTSCAEPADDPDCDPACGAEGTCVLECPVADPDCTTCGADGACDPSCTADPDCGPGGSCGSDGSCNLNCSDDPDCWHAGNATPQDYDGDLVQSGCQLGRSSDDNHATWLLAALACLGFRRRRRTANA